MSDLAGDLSGPAGSLFVANQTLPSEKYIAGSDQLTEELFYLLFHPVTQEMYQETSGRSLSCCMMVATTPT